MQCLPALHDLNTDAVAAIGALQDIEALLSGEAGTRVLPVQWRSREKLTPPRYEFE